MPVHTYTNWNQRPSDHEEQMEPFRKYFFICEGASVHERIALVAGAFSFVRNYRIMY